MRKYADIDADNMKNLLYAETTFKIRGACFEVWKHFGSAFKEKIIDNALTLALEKKGLTVKSQLRIDIYYEGEKVGTYSPDKIVNDEVLLELKCKPFLTQEDRKQFWYYLKASKYRLGLLINLELKNYKLNAEYMIVHGKKFPRIPRHY